MTNAFPELSTLIELVIGNLSLVIAFQ